MSKILVKSLRQIIKVWVERAWKFYQGCTSTGLIPSCRFYPSCSSYFCEAVKSLGVIRGTIKGCWRLLRCSPLSAGGYDPVGGPEYTNK